MNQVQRKYLIDKIKAKANEKINGLKNLRTEQPKINNYLVASIMAGTIKYRRIDDIADTIREKVMQSKDSHSAFKTRWDSFGDKIELRFDELFVIPDEYSALLESWKIDDSIIRKQIYEIEMQMEGLETRIMLASDKVLNGIINDIDDMGNLALVDIKLKALTQ